MSNNLQEEKINATVADGTAVSSWFAIRSWAFFIGWHMATMTEGNIGLEGTLDGGSNVVTILNPTTGVAAVVAATGSIADSSMDFSDLVRPWGISQNDSPDSPDSSNKLIRLTFSENQGAARTFQILQRGG